MWSLGLVQIRLFKLKDAEYSEGGHKSARGPYVSSTLVSLFAALRAHSAPGRVLRQCCPWQSCQQGPARILGARSYTLQHSPRGSSRTLRTRHTIGIPCTAALPCGGPARLGPAWTRQHRAAWVISQRHGRVPCSGGRCCATGRTTATSYRHCGRRPRLWSSTRCAAGYAERERFCAALLG